jgi:hypothetical protein
MQEGGITAALTSHPIGCVKWISALFYQFSASESSKWIVVETRAQVAQFGNH